MRELYTGTEMPVYLDHTAEHPVSSSGMTTRGVRLGDPERRRGRHRRIGRGSAAGEDVEPDAGGVGVHSDHSAARALGRRQCIIAQNDQRKSAELQNYTLRGNVCETYGWQSIEFDAVPNITMDNDYV